MELKTETPARKLWGDYTDSSDYEYDSCTEVDDTRTEVDDTLTKFGKLQSKKSGKGNVVRLGH